ncbi:39S ribosomal protein L44, mitochondrial isoform X2 [Venturia canescens]|uniref:39S ribosomal protein L44, mitochondrial isoform X2 n=1 Tax=Venturia canescens TaxID=32260 RepID=UPI001C9CDF7F|nr:39S ribosomal protein L44, mitochondrial isoform X2 [Venturia canescens]
MNHLRCCSRCVLSGKRVTSLFYTGNGRWIARWMGPAIRELVKRQQRAGPQPESLRRHYLEWNEDAELYAFNSRLSERFEPGLLARAFTFNSYLVREAREQQKVGIESPIFESQDNSDLIEHGKKTGRRIVTAYLGAALPRAPQECIDALLDYLLSPAVVAKAASLIGTKDLILTAESPISEDTLSCTFFALVGALEQSPNVNSIHVVKFIRDFLIACLHEKEITAIWRPREPENVLDDILLRENLEEAEPRLIGQAGVHSLLAVYRVAFYSNQQFLGSGYGETIEEAKEAAAVDSLNRMFGLADFCKPIPYDLVMDANSEVETKNLPLARWCSENVNRLMNR